MSSFPDIFYKCPPPIFFSSPSPPFPDLSVPKYTFSPVSAHSLHKSGLNAKSRGRNKPSANISKRQFAQKNAALQMAAIGNGIALGTKGIISFELAVDGDLFKAIVTFPRDRTEVRGT